MCKNYMMLSDWSALIVITAVTCNNLVRIGSGTISSALLLLLHEGDLQIFELEWLGKKAVETV